MKLTDSTVIAGQTLTKCRWCVSSGKGPDCSRTARQSSFPYREFIETHKGTRLTGWRSRQEVVTGKAVQTAKQKRSMAIAQTDSRTSKVEHHSQVKQTEHNLRWDLGNYKNYSMRLQGVKASVLQLPWNL